MNYTQLRSLLTHWLLRTGDDSFGERLPEFILLAEAAMERRLRVPELEKIATIDIGAESAIYPLPVDFQRHISMHFVSATVPANVPSGRVINAMELHALQQQYREMPNGAPRAYALWGNQILFGPRPDADYRLELVYYSRLPALGDATPTNAVLDRYPDLYLYSTLVEALPTIGGDPALVAGYLAQASNRLEQAVAQLNADNVGSKYAQARVQGRRPSGQ